MVAIHGGNSFCPKISNGMLCIPDVLCKPLYLKGGISLTMTYLIWPFFFLARGRVPRSSEIQPPMSVSIAQYDRIRLRCLAETRHYYNSFEIRYSDRPHARITRYFILLVVHYPIQMEKESRVEYTSLKSYSLLRVPCIYLRGAFMWG